MGEDYHLFVDGTCIGIMLNIVWPTEGRYCKLFFHPHDNPDQIQFFQLASTIEIVDV